MKEISNEHSTTIYTRMMAEASIRGKLLFKAKQQLKPSTSRKHKASPYLSIFTTCLRLISQNFSLSASATFQRDKNLKFLKHTNAILSPCEHGDNMRFPLVMKCKIPFVKL
jgi:hypothetical protein